MPSTQQHGQNRHSWTLGGELHLLATCSDGGYAFDQVENTADAKIGEGDEGAFEDADADKASDNNDSDEEKEEVPTGYPSCNWTTADNLGGDDNKEGNMVNGQRSHTRGKPLVLWNAVQNFYNDETFHISGVFYNRGTFYNRE